jgi:hypothetical protein
MIDLVEMSFSLYVWALPELNADPAIQTAELHFENGRKLHFDVLRMRTLPNKPFEGVQSIVGKARESFEGGFRLPTEVS